MIPPLKVNFEHLREHEEELARVCGALQDHLDEVQSGGARLAELWTGESARAFQQAFAEWTARATDLRASLERLRTVIETAHDNYADARRATLRIWGGQ
ncbi:WXG100 family type VII secretion target [Kitasatospora sp. NPDC008050]|uniref:WXG100 family type VII secretion target n=1 Tax=Kitasatospora sp. NPDC008050 TaxID=3364021 RepID=UPI0036E3CEAC